VGGLVLGAEGGILIYLRMKIYGYTSVPASLLLSVILPLTAFGGLATSLILRGVWSGLQMKFVWIITFGWLPYGITFMLDFSHNSGFFQIIGLVIVGLITALVFRRVVRAVRVWQVIIITIAWPLGWGVGLLIYDFIFNQVIANFNQYNLHLKLASYTNQILWTIEGNFIKGILFGAIAGSVTLGLLSKNRRKILS
jgi:hypothetical protein